MLRARRSRAILLGLALAYLTWSALAMTIIAGQAAGHHHHGSHAAQHSTAACQLLCTAAAFIHTAGEPLQQTARLTLESPPVAHDRIFANLQIYALYSRPPPFPLS
jgi:hypothetical protein